MLIKNSANLKYAFLSRTSMGQLIGTGNLRRAEKGSGINL